MKRKQFPKKQFTPVSAVAAVVTLAAAGAYATPVFDYTFPSSWGGTGTAVTDESSAGNNGSTLGTAALAAALPPGGTGNSLNTTAGGVYTTGKGLLNNTTVAAAGGFDYSLGFMWNGTDTSSYNHVQKLIDYAGTESLQLVTTAGGTATLEMIFGGDSTLAPNVPETVAVSTSISQNTWYSVNMFFNSTGNSVVNGDLSGAVSMVVNGGAPITGTATKGTYGDSLNRPLGVGLLGLSPYGRLVGFYGDIYDPTVTLVPEPSSTALGLVGGLGVVGMMWKSRRRKS